MVRCPLVHKEIVAVVGMSFAAMVVIKSCVCLSLAPLSLAHSYLAVALFLTARCMLLFVRGLLEACTLLVVL